jgi:GT2 family glycosyltransferase
MLTAHAPRIGVLFSSEVANESREKFWTSVPKALKAKTLFLLNSDDSIETPQDFQYLALVSGDLELLGEGLTAALAMLADDNAPDVTYFDSLQRDPSGRARRIRRPAFSPELFRSTLNLGDVVFLRRNTAVEAFLAAGLFSDVAVLSFLLERIRTSGTIIHRAIPVVCELGISGLASRVQRDSDEVRTVLQAHLDATGGGVITSDEETGRWRTRRVVAGAPLVSVIMPTRGLSGSGRLASDALVVNAVRSIVEKSTYKNIEIVLVLDGGYDEEVLENLVALAGDRLRVVPWEEPFNFSRKMNHGFLHARGDYTLLLNDDVEVISPDWIESMLALAQLPDVGLVGAMLYFQDDTIQHAGVTYRDLSPIHVEVKKARGTIGPDGVLLVDREVAAVTAACALLSRSVYAAVGGFTSLLPGNFNDIDLCQKIAGQGLRILFTPHAELHHFESKSRSAHLHFYERDVLERRWAHLIKSDPLWPYNG